MHVRFTQIKERVTAAPGNSLLAKAVSCAVSVVKADRVQSGAATSHVRWEISISERFVTFLLDCTFGKMILPRLKSSIPAGFCKLNRRWSLFQRSSVFLVSIIFRIRTRKCTKLFTENKAEYFVHTQTVCTRPLLGGEGPGDEASIVPNQQYDVFVLILYISCLSKCIKFTEGKFVLRILSCY